MYIFGCLFVDDDSKKKKREKIKWNGNRSDIDEEIEGKEWKQANDLVRPVYRKRCLINRKSGEKVRNKSGREDVHTTTEIGRKDTGVFLFIFCLILYIQTLWGVYTGSVYFIHFKNIFDGFFFFFLRLDSISFKK